jgi:hypothetical protein
VFSVIKRGANIESAVDAGSSALLRGFFVASLVELLELLIIRSALSILRASDINAFRLLETSQCRRIRALRLLRSFPNSVLPLLGILQPGGCI